MSGALVLASCSCDAEWVARLRQHLRAHRERAPSTWAREDVRAGERAREAMQVAFEAAPAALLLVSPQFIADDMSPGCELYAHVLATAARGAPVLWIPLSYSAYRSTELRGYRALHDPEHPLDGLEPAALNRALVEICSRLLAVLAERTAARSTREPDALVRWMVERLSEAEIRQVLAAHHPRGAELVQFLQPWPRPSGSPTRSRWPGTPRPPRACTSSCSPCASAAMQQRCARSPASARTVSEHTTSRTPSSRGVGRADWSDAGSPCKPVVRVGGGSHGAWPVRRAARRSCGTP